MHKHTFRVKPLFTRLAVVAGSIALIAGMSSFSAQAATTVQPDGSWQRIITQGGVDGGTKDGPYEFTTTAAVTKILVLDAFCHGDEFHVFDNGVLLGDTSHVTVAEDDNCPFTLFLPEVPGRPNAALADDGFSRGEFYVAPGHHSLEVTNKVVSDILPTSMGTGAYFRLETVSLDKADCKVGGWEEFGTLFTNQGQCISLSNELNHMSAVDVGDVAFAASPFDTTATSSGWYLPER